VTLKELMALTPDAWADEHEAALGDLIVAALAGVRTVRWSSPCADKPSSLHWARVQQRIHEQHIADIHTCGTGWNGTVIEWNFSGWADKTAPAQRRTVVRLHA
jgi:hypothetical protein